MTTTVRTTIRRLVLGTALVVGVAGGGALAAPAGAEPPLPGDPELVHPVDPPDPCEFIDCDPEPPGPVDPGLGFVDPCAHLGEDCTPEEPPVEVPPTEEPPTETPEPTPEPEQPTPEPEPHNQVQPQPAEVDQAIVAQPTFTG